MSQQDVVRLNINISKSMNRMINENAHRNGYPDKTKYLKALIEADNARWKDSASKTVQKEMLHELQDEMARISSVLGIKAQILPQLTFKVYYEKWQAEHPEVSFEDYLKQIEYSAPITETSDGKTVFMFPTNERQIAYLISLLQTYLLKRNSTIVYRDRPIPITSDELTLYGQILHLRFKGNQPLTSSEISVESNEDKLE